MEPAILPVKPGTISAEDKAALREIGVLVIEHEHPSEIRIIKPAAEVDGGEMLRCAMRALSEGAGASAEKQREHFTMLLAQAMVYDHGG